MPVDVKRMLYLLKASVEKIALASPRKHDLLNI